MIELKPEIHQSISESLANDDADENIINQLKTKGYDTDSAVHLLNLVKRLREAALAQHTFNQSQTSTSTPIKIEVEEIPSPIATGFPTVIDCGDIIVSIVARLEFPKTIIFENVLTDEECNELIELAVPKLHRSTVIEHNTGNSVVDPVRTSQGMYFQRGENPLVERVERRLAKLTNWPYENGEGLQILNYKPGEEYKPHYDFFDVNSKGTPVVLRTSGQRVGTVVLYLNTPVEGGSTFFPDINLHVMPKKGSAVFFAYKRADSSSKTLHGGSPVIVGEKWIATKWLRENKY